VADITVGEPGASPELQVNGSAAELACREEPTFHQIVLKSSNLSVYADLNLPLSFPHLNVRTTVPPT
jgi:hypothetical protein